MVDPSSRWSCHAGGRNTRSASRRTRLTAEATAAAWTSGLAIQIRCETPKI
eukprot:m.159045 g.159045  ORF g.159045 m.159045 type:complete len:51 (-) comp14517_c0_seq1:21-173(-)